MNKIRRDNHPTKNPPPEIPKGGLRLTKLNDYMMTRNIGPSQSVSMPGLMAI